MATCCTICNMLGLPERLLRTIQKQDLLCAGDRVAVAVSGGADSVALLLLLLELRSELGIVLSAAHVNHELRGAESDEDQKFVEGLAAAHQLELDAIDAPIQKKIDGGSAHSGIEAAARELRYQFFSDLVRRGRVSKVATAHTLDDQAETVLLRVFRGTGIRGLAGIHPRIALEEAAARSNQLGEIVRPLLLFRRAEVREYLQAKGQAWREDSSNNDPEFLRNRLRLRLLPLITQEFGDAALEHMADLAEIARAEEEWAAASQPSDPDTHSQGLDVGSLLALPLAVQRRIARAWLESNSPDTSISFRLIEEILDLACGPAGKKLELTSAAADQPDPPAKTVRRSRTELILECSSTPTDYEYALPVPGEVLISELQVLFEARLVEAQSIPPSGRDALLDPQRVGPKLTIRNWRAGDRFWPAHSAGGKKVKELLADRHATGSEKKLWPVAVSATGELVWMRGFPVPAAIQARTGPAIWIYEHPLNP